MGGRPLGDPSDDELIKFAAEILGPDALLSDEQLLRETVGSARALWRLLYRAHYENPPQA